MIVNKSQSAIRLLFIIIIMIVGCCCVSFIVNNGWHYYHLSSCILCVFCVVFVLCFMADTILVQKLRTYEVPCTTRYEDLNSLRKKNNRLHTRTQKTQKKHLFFFFHSLLSNKTKHHHLSVTTYSHSIMLPKSSLFEVMKYHSITRRCGKRFLSSSSSLSTTMSSLVPFNKHSTIIIPCCNYLSHLHNKTSTMLYDRKESKRYHINYKKNNNNIKQEIDFFGEPITFFLEDEKESIQNNNNNKSKLFSHEEALISYDAFILQYITKGKASNDGGDEFGISAKAAHSTAIPWSDLILHLLRSCYEVDGEGGKRSRWLCRAPMLACATISPILALGGSSYLKLLDESYVKSMTPSFTTMAHAAVSCLTNEIQYSYLTEREKYHLRTLGFLLDNDYTNALSSLRKLLNICPGDALGLSLAMDIAYVTGDKENAFHAATSVAAYWNERGQRSATGQTAIPGFAIGSSLIAVGLAVGGRYREAEQLVDIALKRDSGASSGLCAWALAHIYDCEGRVSEGTSAFTGYGKEYYENCGFMFFDSILAGVGGRYILDRDGASADKVATRLYDEYFGRIFEYSGYDDSTKGAMFKSAPKSRRKILAESATGVASSVFSQLFGKDNQTEKQNEHIPTDLFTETKPKSRNLEDIIAWLPPTPHFLTEATFFLTRLTINETIKADDERWAHLRSAWLKSLGTEQKYSNGSNVFTESPVIRSTSSLVLGHHHFGDYCSDAERMMSLLGNYMKLNNVNSNIKQEQWEYIAETLSDIRCRIGEQNRFGWNQNYGNFLEHLICYASIESGNDEMLCLARSTCSESIFLRGNSPEAWFRYGIVLKKLGDEENAENAFQASISLGSGEGGNLRPS